ncbi:hypothetical protein [Actinocrispum sp. NPDC049592]|uniref:hypothetical protein n=1 Tax=Actinocrispum sp. NPDC049592 TaxID=3154835 RepID=UPI003423C18D
MSRQYWAMVVLSLCLAGCGARTEGSGSPGGAPLVPVQPAAPPTSDAGLNGNCAAIVSRRVSEGVAPQPLCLPVNGSLRLTMDESVPLASSDAKILSCAADAGKDVLCSPHVPGTVTVSATKEASFKWELRVTVVANGLN